VTIPADEEWKRDAIRQLLTSQAKKIFQNGPFDYTVLTALGYAVANWSWDTMFAHHARYPECAGGDDEMSALSKKRKTAALKKGLAFQTSIYTEEPYYKEDGKLWKKEGDINLFWLYNSKDAAVTREIKDVQVDELREFSTQHIANEALEQAKVLINVTNRGIKIDTVYWPQLRAEYVKEVENLQKALDSLCGESVNVKSPPQMQKLLYTKLQLPVKYSRKTHNPTADKDAINELAGKYSHPILKFILEVRERRDFIERYLDVTVDRDGRMRCQFDVTGTKSGRLSSRASIWGSGTNLQNIPSRKIAGQKIRKGFIPDEGMVFVNRDLSQAEARLVAVLARCDRLIELFEDSSRDVHTENASRIFRIPLETVTFENRYLAKRVVHASNYGMGPDRLVQLVAEDAETTGVRIDYKQAQELIDKYFMLYPEIKSIFWKEVEDELRHTRTLNTPFGRKREFYGRWDDKLLRDAYSYIPQSTIGDMGRKALYNIYQELEVKQGICEVLLNVHDSVMVQCLPERVVEVSNKMEELMKFPLEINTRKLLVPSDCKVGLNWMERPKKNPELNLEGLRDIKTWLKEHNAAQTIKLD
jgi:DNA polymerase-1